jgi:hypothetical protein
MKWALPNHHGGSAPFPQKGTRDDATSNPRRGIDDAARNAQHPDGPAASDGDAVLPRSNNERGAAW